MRTAYGDLLASALQNTEDQNYDAAVNYYTAILQRNNNYDSAYVGIGRAFIVTANICRRCSTLSMPTIRRITPRPIRLTVRNGSKNMSS